MEVSLDISDSASFMASKNKGKSSLPPCIFCNFKLNEGGILLAEGCPHRLLQLGANNKLQNQIVQAFATSADLKYCSALVSLF